MPVATVTAPLASVAPPSPADPKPQPQGSAGTSAHPFAELLRQNRLAASAHAPQPAAPAAPARSEAGPTTTDDGAAASSAPAAAASSGANAASAATGKTTTGDAAAKPAADDDRSDETDAKGDAADEPAQASRSAHAAHAATPGLHVSNAADAATLAHVAATEATCDRATLASSAPGGASPSPDGGGAAANGAGRSLAAGGAQADSRPGADHALTLDLAVDRASTGDAKALSAKETPAAPGAPDALLTGNAGSAGHAAAPLPATTFASTLSAATAAAPTQGTVATPVDSALFASAFGVQVSLLAQGGVQHAELHLNPADMGPVSVQITLDGNQARVDFGADVAATRQAIEAGLPELAAALRDAGLTLSGGGVSQHASGGGGRDGGDGGFASGTAPSRGDAAASADAATPVLRGSVTAGGVDTYA